MQIQFDGADYVLVSWVDNPEIVQHCGRAGEVEFAELIEQATANDIDIDLSTENVESGCFLGSVFPVRIMEFAAFLPGQDGSSTFRTNSPIVDDMFIDLIPYPATN